MITRYVHRSRGTRRTYCLAGIVACLAISAVSGNVVAGTPDSIELGTPGLLSEPAADAGLRYTDSIALADPTAAASVNAASYSSSEDAGPDDANANCCPCGHGCGGGPLLGWCGLVQPSDPCYRDFVSPMTNPTFFEDPRNLTEARLIFLNHKVPGRLGGGDIQLYALQIRAALTDRLSFIATKDGYIVSSNPLIDDGWADLSGGLKYLLYSDPCAEQLLSGGVVYKAPVGSHRSIQGTGDGTFHLFLSGGAKLCCDAHWISNVGVVVPTDGEDESELFYWSNHFDYYLGHCWYFLTEFNWFNYLNSGDRLNTSWEGGDLYNIGAANVAGHDIVTGAFGFKYKPNCGTEIGVAWEFPLTERRDVLENRITCDWIWRY